MGAGPLLRSSAWFVPIVRSLLRCLAMLVLLAASVVLSNLALAQSAPNFAGEYAGMLGPLHVKLHLTASRDGALSCTVDSPDQNMVGVPCADVHVNGQSLSYTVPAVQGTYTGLLSGDGASLTGVWSQGSPMPLTLNRVTTATAASAAPSAPAPPTPNAEVKWDDYTYKFDRSGMMAQVFEGGKVVGTILNMNGQQRILPLPGTDATKMTKSFEDYQAFSARSHSGSTATAASPPSPASTNATSPAASTFRRRHHEGPSRSRQAPRLPRTFVSMRQLTPSRFRGRMASPSRLSARTSRSPASASSITLCVTRRAPPAASWSAVSDIPTRREAACPAEVRSFCWTEADLFTIRGWAPTPICSWIAPY